jgi:S-adenosylmethionine hydrolase
MPIITLTTDLGNTDHYVSAVKANILRQLESVNIIDISHNIPTFNVLHAAFVLKNVYKDFPPGSIHIIGVNA